MAGLLFKLGNIPIAVEYKQVKTLRMTIYPSEGQVRISAPLSAGPESIQNFILSKQKWIETHREKFRRVGGFSRLESGDSVPVWGEIFLLEAAIGRYRPRIELSPPGHMKMYIKPETSGEKRLALLDAWYRRRLRETAPGIIAKWAARLGVKTPGLFIRKMKTHWGSCSYTKGTIRLNSQLVQKNPLCLEYVIVHELIHFKESSHNRNFYRLLGQAIPDWKEIRKKMNSGEL
jgi:predicted metal-dependent hydrolase